MVGDAPLCWGRGGARRASRSSLVVTAAAAGSRPGTEGPRAPPRRSCLPCPPQAWPRDLDEACVQGPRSEVIRVEPPCTQRATWLEGPPATRERTSSLPSGSGPDRPSATGEHSSAHANRLLVGAATSVRGRHPPAHSTCADASLTMEWRGWEGGPPSCAGDGGVLGELPDPAV